MTKLRLLTLSLFALTFALAFATPATAEATPADGCQLDVATLLPPTLASVTPAAAPALEPTTLQPDFLVTYTGYCRCSCSFAKNCRTSADCGGSPCLGGVTCC